MRNGIIAMLFMTLFIFSTTATTTIVWSSPEQTSDLGAIIIVVLDGLRPDKLEVASTPNLDRLIAEGLSFNCTSVSPSATVIAHTTIVTGAYAEVHGIVAEKTYDPAENKLIYIRSREHVEAQTIFDLVETESPDLVTALIAGKSKLVMLDRNELCDIVVVPPYPDDVSAATYDPDPATVNLKLQMNEIAMDEAIRVWNESKPNLLFVSMPSIDYVGHTMGPDSTYYRSAIEHADTQLGRLLDILPANVTVLVTADHGMTETDSGLVVETLDVLETAGIVHWMTDTGGGTGFVWLEDSEKLEEAIGLLDADTRFDRLFTREGVAGTETLASVRLDHTRSGDIWFQMAAGYPLMYANEGTHGSLRDSAMQVPLILWGPTVVHRTIVENASLIDVAPTTLTALGIDPVKLEDSQGSVLLRLMGPTGPQGETGSQGPTGPAGPTGSAGEAGEPAPMGVVWASIIIAIVALLVAIYAVTKHK